MQLYSHQKEAIEKLRNGRILYGDVGSGKSLTALGYFFEKICGGQFSPFHVQKPTKLVIITTAKKRNDHEWDHDALHFHISRIRENSFCEFIVDSWNNIHKYTEVKDAFFIFDEQRLVGSGTWVKSFLHITKSNEWIILSATPGDTWLDYIPVFIANGFYRNRTEFKEKHVIYDPYSKFPKVKKYVLTDELIRNKRKVLVLMPFPRHTTRHIKKIRTIFDKERYDSIMTSRWNIFKDQPIRNVAELFYTMRKCVNSDESRLYAVRDLLKKHDRLIIFYNFDYELEILRTWKDDGFNVAEYNGHKHESIPEADHWVYLVQYLAGSEGWNCTSTDAMCFYSLTYSYKRYEQAQGRIDRLNTKYQDLYYYLLISNSGIDLAIYKSLANKRSFNEVEMYKNIPKIGQK